MPDDVYADIAAAAKEREVTISKMIVYYAVQGFALTLRGFHIAAAPLDKRYLAPLPRSWPLSMDVQSPRAEIEERVAIEVAKRMANR
jgi:hypothetical protein